MDPGPLPRESPGGPGAGSWPGHSQCRSLPVRSSPPMGSQKRGPGTRLDHALWLAMPRAEAAQHSGGSPLPQAPESLTRRALWGGGVGLRPCLGAAQFMVPGAKSGCGKDGQVHLPAFGRGRQARELPVYLRTVGTPRPKVAQDDRRGRGTNRGRHMNT